MLTNNKLKLKKGIGLSILLLLCFVAQAQDYNQVIDDLGQALHAYPNNDETRVDLLNDISYAYRRSAPEKVDSFAKEAFQLAKKLNYQKGMGIAYKNLGIAAFKIGNNIDTSMIFFQKCYDLAEQSKDYYSQAACSNNLGYGYRANLRYDKALKAFQNGYDIHAVHFPTDRLQMLIIGNIGQTYVNINDYENAKIYFDRVITLADKHNNPAITAMYMPGYALVQYKQGQTEKAIGTIIKYLPMLKAIGDYQTFAQSITSLSDILIQEQQFDRADAYLKEGLLFIEQHHFPAQKCELTLNRSIVLLNKKELKEALRLGKNAFECSADNDQLQMKAAKNLLNIYLSTKNTAKAKELFPIYNELMERHFNTEQQKTYAILQVEKKDADNALLEIQQLENKATIKVQRILAWSILLLSLLVTGGALYAYRIKRTQNDLLEGKVSERTKALNESYQKLERSNQELERSNEELERFAYIASHDLKQPINTIISFSDLLKKELTSSEDSKSSTYLGFIIKGANQMKTLIEDILEYSKLSQEKKAPHAIDLNLIVNEVLDSISDLVARKNAQINVKGILPVLHCEKTKMLILFKNLIENGVKYNQSKIPTIDIQQSEHERYTRFSFRDNGIGIEERYFPKLFKMFSRLQNHKDYEGTGLGLSLCKKIVSNMDGEISVESEPEKGSTFHVDIPSDLFVVEASAEGLVG